MLGEAGATGGVGGGRRHHVVPLGPLGKLGPPLAGEEDAGQGVGHHSLVPGLDAGGLEVAVVPPTLLKRRRRELASFKVTRRSDNAEEMMSDPLEQCDFFLYMAEKKGQQRVGHSFHTKGKPDVITQNRAERKSFKRGKGG